jgi:hypothetical protein
VVRLLPIALLSGCSISGSLEIIDPEGSRSDPMNYYYEVRGTYPGKKPLFSSAEFIQLRQMPPQRKELLEDDLLEQNRRETEFFETWIKGPLDALLD